MMLHVLDLTGDWFAMPSVLPYGDPCPCGRDHNPPAVGDVIASTYTDYWVEGSDAMHGKAILWADPPFLRVVEVLPIIHNDNSPMLDGAHFIELWDDGNAVAWHNGENDGVFTLPGAQPGGWAIRVEPTLPGVMPHDGPPPRLDGQPLNQQEAGDE